MGIQHRAIEEKQGLAMLFSKTLFLTIVLICLTNFTRASKCKCYNPVKDNDDSKPEIMCEEDYKKCFVKCDSDCDDKTHVDITNDKIKGHTTLCISGKACDILKSG